METTEKDLEDRLRELGNRLATPPHDVDELLLLLDHTEIALSKVEQSPSISMTDALRPAMNSLISKEFLNHPETDVKVFVAACVNEITRITAPEAPYNDSLMKEVFSMIVDSFGELDDISSRTYPKRVSILETMAKVRSCVVMLDLECNDLILQMFKHFLKTIREDHPIHVFSSMETIMALVLEESEDISQELLMCLLFNGQKSKMDTMPVAHILAKKVVGKCAMKLKPFILVAVQSMGATLSDLIASICHENSCVPEQNEVEGSKISERTVLKEFLQESEKLDKAASSLEKVGGFADKTRKVICNGIFPLGNGNSVVEPFSANIKPEHSFSCDPCRNDIATRCGNDNLDSIAVKPHCEKDLKHMDVKSSSVLLTDTSANSNVDGGNEASALIFGNAGCKWEAKSLQSDDVSTMVPETEVLLQPERDAELRPLEGFVGDNTCINSISPSDSPGSGHTKRGLSTSSHLIAEEGTIHKPASTARKKRKYKNPILDKAGFRGAVFALKEQGADNLLNEKPLQGSEMKSLEDSATVDIEVAVISDAKSSARKVTETDSSGRQRKPSTKQRKGKEFTEGDVSTEPSLKEMIASSKASRAGHKVQNHSGKYEKSSSNKKRHREVTSVAHDNLEPGEHIVGSKIQVWWPDDNQFYSGVVDSFDPETKKHKVLYDDGDIEILSLKDETCKIVDAKGHENDIASSKSLEMSREKQMTSSGNFNVTPKSGSKSAKMSKATQTQQSGSGKLMMKSRGRPRRENLNVGSSLIEEALNSSGKEQANFESLKTNNSDEPSVDIAIVEHNTSSKVKSDGKSKGSNDLLSSGSKSAIRSRDMPRDETSRIVSTSKEETLRPIGKQDGTVLNSSQTDKSGEVIPEDSSVFKDSASKGGTSDGKPKVTATLTSAGRKSYLKSRSRGRTSKRGSTLVEEIVKTQGNDDVINSEFSEENKLHDYPEDTAVVKSNTPGSGSKSKDGLISTHEERDGECMVKPDDKSTKAGRKRKGTAAKTDANVLSKNSKRGKVIRG